MIDKDTILSVHDDRMTLLQWLKTVEEKQNGIAIKSINYSKESTEGAFEYGFLHIEFEDGKVLNSPEFTLANAEELNTLMGQIATKQDALTPQKLIDFFAPSTDIILDVAEDKSHVEIHLDNELSNKIDKALVHPVTPPATDVIVALNTSNSQYHLKAGKGLKIEKGMLDSVAFTPEIVKQVDFLESIEQPTTFYSNAKAILYDLGQFLAFKVELTGAGTYTPFTKTVFIDFASALASKQGHSPIWKKTHKSESLTQQQMIGIEKIEYLVTNTGRDFGVKVYFNFETSGGGGGTNIDYYIFPKGLQ